jgi:hypothetical protein
VRFRVLAGLTLVWVAVWPSSAQAAPSIYARVLAAYQANGSVPACQFTSNQLEQALKGVDTYGLQYFADFTDAIQTALAARASGACSPGAARALQGAAGRGSQFAAPSITASTGVDLPAPILVLGGLTLALAAGGGLAMVWSLRGWDPRWAAWMRHAAGDAAYRAGSRLDRRR